MDRLGNVEAFVEAAEQGSFTRAAERLGITPSALSRRVAQLEAEVGIRLFNRTTRALRLSDEGREYFERVRGALRALKDASDAAAITKQKPTGLLRVEAPTILGRFVIVPAVTRMLSRHPEVQVELLLRDHPSDLVTEGIDLAVRMGALESSGLIARRLGTTRMSVCGSPAYLRRKGTPRSVDALERHERLAYSAHGRLLPWRLRDGEAIREIAPGRRIVLNNAEALVDLAVSGAGLVWLCDFMIRGGRKEGQLVEVLAESSCEALPIHAVSLPGRNVLPKVRAFTELIADELKRSA